MIEISEIYRNCKWIGFLFELKIISFEIAKIFRIKIDYEIFFIISNVSLTKLAFIYYKQEIKNTIKWLSHIFFYYFFNNLKYTKKTLKSIFYFF